MATNDIVKGVLESFEDNVTEAIRKSLEKNKRVASATLYGTIIATTKVYGQKVVLEIRMDSYGKFVNEGVNGTQQNRGSRFSFKKKNLKQGVMLKHIANRGEYLDPIVQSISRSYKNKNGKTIIRKKPLTSDKARKTLAFLLGRKIAKKGVEPTNFVEEGLNSGVLKEMQMELLKVVGREIKLEISKEFLK